MNEIVNRLNKTKREEKPDFRVLREERDRQERDEKKAEYKKQQEQEKVMQKQREEEAKLRSVPLQRTEDQLVITAYQSFLY